jgi:hypothetical protein
MKRTLYLFICVALITGTSCKAIFYRIKGVNRPFNFKSKEAYASYLQKIAVNPEMVYYISDSAGWGIMNTIIDENISAYYGAFINDSTELEKSDALKENMSCMGRILHDIELNENEFYNQKIRKSDFYRYHFKSLENQALLNINKSAKKLKIVLVYSYSFGKLFKKTFTEVNSFYEKNKTDCDLFIISIDPVAQLK